MNLAHDTRQYFCFKKSQTMQLQFKTIKPDSSLHKSLIII